MGAVVAGVGGITDAGVRDAVAVVGAIVGADRVGRGEVGGEEKEEKE